MRCQYSNYGKERLRPKLPGRKGTLLGFTKFNSPLVKVLWDGRKTAEICHQDFIQEIDDVLHADELEPHQ